MATGKLNAIFVRTAKQGKHGDGNGLWLYVTAGKSWVYRYSIHGKEHYLGLGAYPAVSLAEARKAAEKARALKAAGINPLTDKKAAKLQARLDEAKALTFAQCAEKYIEAHRASWKNAKHRQQWTNTLATYAAPINTLPIAGIDTGLVLECLEPIWHQIPETASRVRNRMELVLDWATARELREGANPARWRGHLDKLLPRKSKVAPVKHHPAMPYQEIPEFMAALRERNGIAAAALEFTLLTATRSGEALGARWKEVDFDKGTWTIPGERMKAGKTHTVPLSDRATAILRDMEAIGINEFIFAGAKAGKGLSNMAMTNTMRRMDYGRYTVHGFRSTFRDWAAERTNTPNIVCEMALAHAIGNATEAAYRRGDLLEKRHRLMTDWASYCEQTPGKVVSINGRGVSNQV